MARARSGGAKPSRRRRARQPRGRVAAPCRRRARPPGAAAWRGIHPRGAPRRDDAGGEGRRRSALDLRQPCRPEFAGIAACKRGAASRAAGRKYNVPVDELAELARRCESDLGLIDAGAERLAGLEREAREASARYRAGAENLSAARRGTARALDKAVNAELKPLKLERAEFSTEIDSESEGPNGVDRVEFWVRTNPG